MRFLICDFMCLPSLWQKGHVRIKTYGKAAEVTNNITVTHHGYDYSWGQVYNAM